MSYELEVVGGLKQITKDGTPLTAPGIVEKLNRLTERVQLLQDKRDQSKVILTDAMNRLGE